MLTEKKIVFVLECVLKSMKLASNNFFCSKLTIQNNFETEDGKTRKLRIHHNINNVEYTLLSILELL